MKQSLLSLLICPGCLPVELGLDCLDGRAQGDEIVSGRLHCPGCGSDYPIEDGIAVLLPEDARTPQGRYEQDAVLASYLWSHYADLLDDPDSSDAYLGWARLIPPGQPLCLDVGCAVGRFTFELAAKGQYAIGIDRSFAFIRAARQLQRGALTLRLPLEGELYEELQLQLPDRLRVGQTEFLVADALALPFRRDSFSCLGSLNLLDKLPRPLEHLHQADRVSQGRDATLLISDPFSWSSEVADADEWLGGRSDGPYAGRGRRNLRRLLQGGNGQLRPWRIEDEGQLWWTIRNHANHFELIRSVYLLARR